MKKSLAGILRQVIFGYLFLLLPIGFWLIWTSINASTLSNTHPNSMSLERILLLVTVGVMIVAGAMLWAEPPNKRSFRKSSLTITHLIVALVGIIWLGKQNVEIDESTEYLLSHGLIDNPNNVFAFHRVLASIYVILSLTFFLVHKLYKNTKLKMIGERFDTQKLEYLIRRRRVKNLNDFTVIPKAVFLFFSVIALYGGMNKLTSRNMLIVTLTISAIYLIFPRKRTVTHDVLSLIWDVSLIACLILTFYTNDVMDDKVMRNLGLGYMALASFSSVINAFNINERRKIY